MACRAAGLALVVSLVGLSSDGESVPVGDTRYLPLVVMNVAFVSGALLV